MKTFYIQYGIGKSKYVVSYHNGIRFHEDGSEFFDVRIFKNKKNTEKFIQELKQEGYTERKIIK